MQVETTQPGLRWLVAIPTNFRALALASAVMLWLIVATGATVRLTASGLGCEHWPGCAAGHPFPEKDYHAFIEFGNRIVAATTIALTLVTWVCGLLTPGLATWARRLALATFVGTLAQAPLGAITVYANLNPLLVMSHLLLSLVVLGAGVVVAVEAWNLETGRAAPLVPGEVRWLGIVTAVSLLGLLVSGTFVTAAGPHPGGEDVRRLGSLSTALYVHVRVTAVFGCAFLFLLGYLEARRA